MFKSGLSKNVYFGIKHANAFSGNKHNRKTRRGLDYQGASNKLRRCKVVSGTALYQYSDEECFIPKSLINALGVMYSSMGSKSLS